jgi:hypothetical protein
MYIPTSASAKQKITNFSKNSMSILLLRYNTVPSHMYNASAREK